MIKMGFEAEFVCSNYDYLDFAPILAKELGVKTDIITMFDQPDFRDHTWYTCADASVDETLGEGIELITPPMRVSEALRWLPEVFRVIRTHGRTDASCGLHMTFSTGFPTDIRRVIAQANDAVWLTAFGRHDHPFLKCSLDHLMDGTTQFWDKDYSINEHRAGRYEFKHVGGAHYENRLPMIKLAMSDFLMALVNARDCSVSQISPERAKIA